MDYWVGPSDRPETYRLLAHLGGGGEGEVWAAELPLSEAGTSRCAVKILPAGVAAEAWTRHVHLLQALRHPSVVRVLAGFTGGPPHAAGESLPGDRAYLVMELVDGPTLGEWLARQPDADLFVRLRLLRTVAAVIDYMHSGRDTGVPVAHGDIKPSNILVTDDNRVVLTDFGLAALADTADTRHGRSSLAYTAPELLTSTTARSTPDSDRFAFAATVFTVLTGQLVPRVTGTDAGGPVDWPAVQHLLATIPLLDTAPDLPPAILAGLSPNPADRPTALDPWLAEASTTRMSRTNPPGTRPPTSPPTTKTGPGTTHRKTPWLIAAACLALVIVAGGGLLATGALGSRVTPAAAVIATPTKTPAPTKAKATPTPSFIPTTTVPSQAPQIPTGPTAAFDTTVYSGPGSQHYSAVGTLPVGSALTVACGVYNRSSSRGAQLWVFVGRGWVPADHLTGPGSTTNSACTGNVANPSPSAVSPDSTHGPFPINSSDRQGTPMMSGPSPASAMVGVVAQGQLVTVRCSVRGTGMAGPEDTNNTYWDDIGDGQTRLFVSDADILTIAGVVAPQCLDGE